MARMSDKEFILRDMLKRYRKEKDQLLRQHARIVEALKDTNNAIKSAKEQLDELLKPKKKTAKKKSAPKKKLEDPTVEKTTGREEFPPKETKAEAKKEAKEDEKTDPADEPSS